MFVSQLQGWEPNDLTGEGSLIVWLVSLFLRERRQDTGIMIVVLSICNLLGLTLMALFTYESVREQERRASRIGFAGIACHLVLGALILWVPAARLPLFMGFGLCALAALAFLIPCRVLGRSLQGAMGYAVGEVGRIDERDIVFARNRTLRPGSREYRTYYDRHPESKERDDVRRAKGGPLGRMGSLDKEYPPNVAMLRSTFELPAFLMPHAKAAPGESAGGQRSELDPAAATRIVKGWAKHLGADLVGVCRLNPQWAYSHRGEIHQQNWQDWGQPLAEPLPYAVVVATAMDNENIKAAPHTPTVIESGLNYARGAFITTELARWFAHMGYRASAEHSRHYELLMVPLAVDAGLGELGRQGYLITDRYGPGVRLFAVQTDMPLFPDQPVDLGAEAFCQRCLKCAEACPSKSIPRGEQTVVNGLKRWMLDAESCFDYWGKVGTDCCICMAICPFNRPNRSIHRLVRWLLRRSIAARIVLPYLDNFIYGRKWRPREAPDWIRPPKGRVAEPIKNKKNADKFTGEPGA